MSETSNEEQQSEKLFIEGYQVFCNEAGQPDSANPSKPAENSPERDPDDLPVTFEVKTEPVDPDYEASASPACTSSPATMPIMTLPPPRQRPQLKDVLPRLKQMQEMNASAAPANVIDELLKKNEFLLAKNNTGDYKPHSRKSRNLGDIKRPENLLEANPQTFLVSPTSQARVSKVKPGMGPKSKMARYGKILRPRSPTRKCSIPEKDKSHFNYALIESSVKDKSSDKIFKIQKHEMVCAVTCKAMFMTQGGAIKGDFDLQFYWCNFCTFHTTNKAQLVQHGMEHRFHCKYCRYQSFSRADIIHHSANEHADDFRETANSMKYCILLSDYLQIYSQDTDEDRKKRAAPDDDEDGDDEPPQKAAKLEGRSVDSLSAEELKTLQNDYQIFDMDVETIAETEKTVVTEEPSTSPSTSINVPSDQQIIANSGLATYESPSAISNMGIAESCIQSAMMQNTVPNSRNVPTPVSLVAANSSRLASPGGQYLIQNVANSLVRPPQTILPKQSPSTISPVLSHRLKETRPPPPLPAIKPKPGPTSSVSSSLYWSCGYCSFTSHSQSEIKEHSQKSHRGKPHRYVALIMPSDKQSQNGQNADGAKEKNEANISNKDIEIDHAEEFSDSVPIERESESFKCFHCKFLVKRPDLIKGHLYDKHPSLSMVGVDTYSKRLKNIFYCPREECPFQTKNPALYQSHVERCTPWRELNMTVEKHLVECLENTVKFSKAVQLKEQVSTRLGELSCIYCSFKSHLPSRVKNHVLAKHPFEQMVIMTQANCKRRSCLIHFCSLCFWHTRIKYRRKKHMLAAHNIEDPDICNGKIQIHADDPFKMLKSAPAENYTADCISSQSEKENRVPEWTGAMTSIQDIGASSCLLEEASDSCYADHKCDTKYRCLFCFENCTGMSVMKSHLEKVHPRQKMQAVNVEKCDSEEKCVFFLCPETACSHMYAKESLLIKHAQTHKSLCVSPIEFDSNGKSNTNAKTISDNPEKPRPKCSGTPLSWHDTKVASSKTTTQPALFSKHSHANTNNSGLVYSQGLNTYTVMSAAHVPTALYTASQTQPNPPGHSVVNSHVATAFHSTSMTQKPLFVPTSSTQSIPSPSLGIISKTLNTLSQLHRIDNTQHISNVSLNSSITQNLPTASVSIVSTHKTLSAQLASPSAQQIPAGNTQNISMLAPKHNTPLLVTPSPAVLMIPNTQSLPSRVQPCSGGLRFALLRTPTPHFYQTTMANSAHAVNISNLNVSCPLTVPSGIVGSAAPTQQETSVSLPNVGNLRPEASSGLLLAVVSPSSNLAAVDGRVHVKIMRVSQTKHGVEGEKTSSPLPNYSQHEVHKTEASTCSDISRSDSEGTEQKLKIESVNSLACSLDYVEEGRLVKSDKPTTVVHTEKVSKPHSKLLVKSTVKDNEMEVSEVSSNQSDFEQISIDVKQIGRKKGLKPRYIKKNIIKEVFLSKKPRRRKTSTADQNKPCSVQKRKGRKPKQGRKKSKKMKLEKFICKFCESSIHDGVLAIKAHITDIHPDEKYETYKSSDKEKTYYLCPSDSCMVYFPEESGLISHWTSSHEGQDEVGEAEKPSTSTTQNLKQSPEKAKSPKSKKGYECLYCTVSYVEENMISMKRHYEDQHAGQDMIMRDLQSGTLRNSRIVVCSHQDCCYTKDDTMDADFQYHQLAHKHSRVFACSACKWIYHDNSAATEHLLTHAENHEPASLMQLGLKLEPDGSITISTIK